MRTLVLVALCFVCNATLALDLNGKYKLDGFFLGGGISYVDTNTTLSGNGISYRTADLLFGYKVNGLFNFDARVGTGLQEETVADIVPVDLALDYYASLYWRPESANPVAKIYGLVGVSQVSISSGDTSAEESGFSWGAGVGFVLNERWNLNFETRTILDQDANEFTALSFNADYRF